MKVDFKDVQEDFKRYQCEIDALKDAIEKFKLSGTTGDKFAMFDLLNLESK